MKFFKCIKFCWIAVKHAWNLYWGYDRGSVLYYGNKLTDYQLNVIDGYLEGKSSKDYSNKDSLMPVVYLAGPYRSNTENGIYDNIQTARDYAVKLWHQGYTVLCPHLNTAFMGGVVPDHIFMAGTMELLKRCDKICMLPHWMDSEGAREEYDYAMMHGIEEVWVE